MTGKETKKQGKVWLVGAGPGDVGLFTLKGLEVLNDADVVVYDSLVGDGVLAMVPDGARTIDVGKRASNHTMPQEKISELLYEEALAGAKVVRLKGGDPFLFGRGGEELELLRDHGIPFEVVPGVPSALAVPAYNGIPVTHRDFTSSVHIITGHKRAGAEYDIDFSALVATKGTLVFLMGVRALPDICQGLLDAGMDPDKPAAILAKGTTAGQDRIVATVSTLADEVARRGIETPAIIVVGGVCGLSEGFAWYEKLPLQGCKVVLTRPRDLVSTMAARLRRLGAEVLEVPAIETRPIEDNAALAEALTRLGDYDWVVLTSPTGARVLFDRMVAAGTDVRNLPKVAAIGQGTRKALAGYGIVADFVPSEAYGEILGRELAQVAGPGSRILIPRARIGNPELVARLEEAGHAVDDIPTYDTIPLAGGLVDLPSKFVAGEVFCAAFTSSSGVESFVAAHPGMDFSKVHAACIGKMTAAAAEKSGMQVWMAAAPTMDSLAELIIDRFQNR